MKRGKVRRNNRKCINLVQLVRNRSRYQPYGLRSGGVVTSSSSNSSAQSASINFPLQDYQPTWSSHLESSRNLAQLSHRSSVQNRHGISLSDSSNERVDRAINTNSIASTSVHTQSEVYSQTSVAVFTLLREHKNIENDVPEGDAKHQQAANVNGGKKHVNEAAASADNQQISASYQGQSRTTSTIENPCAQSESEDNLMPEIEMAIVESSEADDDADEGKVEDGAVDNISVNESASHQTLNASASNLAVQVQGAGHVVMGNDGDDGDGETEIPVADEEAGGDGHHNNSVIEIEITLRSGSDTHSEEGDEDEEEYALVVDEESE